ncbi:MAG: glycosyltransferase family 2 protein [Thermoflexales bacterium]|nr:glycosyltransferase family 2 protein [Thermoflexales bacterium]
MMDQPTVAVIVVNWNGRAYLEKCLAALRVQTYRWFEVVVVDNASTDDSVAFVQAAFPEVTVIQLDRNVGFAAGNNIGIRATRSDYVALINTDAYAEPEWLARSIEVAEQRPEAGAIAAKLLFAHDPTIVNACGLALDWAGFCWEWRGGQLDQPADTTVEEIFGPSGAAALYRRQLLDEIGLFDEDFFMYAEDADLNWRAQRAGWKCLHVPAARVRHVASASAIEGSRFKTYHLSRNKIWLLIKNVPGGRYAWWWLILIGYDLLAVLWGLIARRDTAAVAGRWAALRGLRSMWRKRSQSPTRTTDYLKLLKPLQAPWQISARFRYRAKP